MLHLAALLLQILPAQNFPPVALPGERPDLVAGVAGICPSADAGKRDKLLKTEGDLAARVEAHQQAAWSPLACVRANLAAMHTFAREGPDMALGVSWATGALNAALEVLRTSPDDAAAARIASLFLFNQEHADTVEIHRLGTAIRAGVTNATVLRAATEFALQANDTALVRESAQRALALGVDSTWHLIRLARMAFRRADTVAGSTFFVRAAGSARDTIGRQDIDWQLQWFLDPDELATWRALPDSAHAHWVRDRLAARDVRDGQPPGARLAEHFGRLEYVEKNFRLDVPDKRRQAMMNMPAVPEDVNVQGLHYTDFDQRSMAACEAGNVYTTIMREYRRWQVNFDDRGVVWMRWGKPDKMAYFGGRDDSEPGCKPITRSATSGTPKSLITIRRARPVGADGRLLKPVDTAPADTAWEAGVIAREAWLYHIDGQALLANFEGEAFDGSVGATRLVVAGLGTYLCALDITRCSLTQRALMGRMAGAEGVPKERMLQLRDEDRAFISEATTKDDNSPRGAKPLATGGALYRLWDPQTGASIGLATYAIKSGDLMSRSDHTVSFELALRQWDPLGDHWSDTTITVRHELPHDSTRGTAVTGFVVVPSSPGVTTWSLVATQSDGRMGRAWEDGNAALGSGPLVLSDLVLGSDAQELVWRRADERVVLAPLNVLDRKAAVHLYYQIKAASAGPALRTRIAVYRTDTPLKKGQQPVAALTVAFNTAVKAGLNEVDREVDVSRLDAGTYRLVLDIADGSARATRSASMILR